MNVQTPCQLISIPQPSTGQFLFSLVFCFVPSFNFWLIFLSHLIIFKGIPDVRYEKCSVSR